jgi:GH15 family glucan-1,4-alpha-glucosidase
MLKTVEALDRLPQDGGLVKHSLVFRYDPHKTADGIDDPNREEGTFNICSFWTIEALTRG